MRRIDRRGRRLDDPNLEARLARMPKAEMHFHFEGAFRWSTIRELHPRGQELPEREPWLAQARLFADFQDFTQVFRDYIRPATGTPEAVERHAGVFLHVCPTSNVLLEVARGYDTHPPRTLCEAGVRCTVNSDDPLPFGTDVTGEYRVLMREMGFTLREVGEFVKTAFNASLLDTGRKAELCAEVDRTLA